MNQLISNENKTCTYELKYSPSAVFNKVFEKKSKKPTKSNTNAKINYTEFNQKLHSMNNELKNLKNEVKKIHKQR
jgi:predicted mannosyl-3-phosphoglycerate phosphatase (HAD superfamily)